MTHPELLEYLDRQIQQAIEWRNWQCRLDEAMALKRVILSKVEIEE